MNITIQEQDGNIVAILDGSLDTSVAPEAEAALSPLHDVTGQDIILDCTNLQYISSAGLRILLRILKSAESKGGQVFIKGMNSDVSAVFTMTGFIHLFKFT